MRNTKRKIAQFTFYDRTGIQSLLEKEAQKGWMLEKISQLGWKFRRINPADIKFSVTYFPSASVFDPQPSEKQKQFWDFCEHTGWKLVSHNAQMQIFYNTQPDPTPIETDAEIEFENIDKSAKKSFLPSYYMLTGLGVLQIALMLWRYFTDPVEFLSMSSNLFSIVCWGVMISMCLLEITGFFVWRKKARKAIETDGSFTETRGFRNVQLIMLGIITVLFAVFLLSIDIRIAFMCLVASGMVAGVSASVWGFSALLKKFNVTAGTNRILTVIMTIVMSFGVMSLLLITVLNGVMARGWFDRKPADTYEYKGLVIKVYDDELPLMVEDLTGTDYDGYSTSWYGNESILMSKHDAYQHPKMGDLKEYSLQYTLVKIKMPFLKNIAYKSMLKELPHNHGITEENYADYERAVEISPSEWGAEKAYQVYRGDNPVSRYLICYPDSIIEFRPDLDMEITKEVKSVIANKIGGVAVCYD